jgi:hypothetical protein
MSIERLVDAETATTFKDPDTVAAYALRRYVLARAAGRTAPEYIRSDVIDGVEVWAASSEGEASGLCDGKRFRQVRRPGMPWCTYLGADTVISTDHDLQAFFEIIEEDPHSWNALKSEVTRDRRKALKSWRARGRELRLRTRAARSEADLPSLPELALKYADKGTGLK